MMHVLTIFICMLLSFTAFAAKPSGLSKPGATPEVYRLKNPIQQVQELLKAQGLYIGTIDGLMGADLENAIKQYQKNHGVKQTGKVNSDLIKHIENIGRVRALINRLDQVRQARREEARQALLADPRTRKLLEDKETKTADPTRDVSACFKSPTSNCLLQEAVESSRAVFEDDMRDWALGEILAAQVRVGLEGDAMKTAARIKDSRLVIAALTNIAKAHVREGKVREAITSLSLIPVAERRLAVLLKIAEFYLHDKQNDRLVNTVNKILAGAQAIEAIEDSLPIQVKAVELLSHVDKKRALGLLDELAEQVRNSARNGSAITLLRQSASAMAKIGYPEWALKAVEDLPDDETRIPILMEASRAFLKMKRFEAARTTIERISAKRYRSVILSDMARALWLAGQSAQTFQVLDEAFIIAKAVKLPFAKNYALSNIAQTYIQIVSDTRQSKHADQAYQILDMISDDRIKARNLWDLAYASKQHDFASSSADLQREADEAMEEIKSVFSRVWVLGDLVKFHQKAGDIKQAQKAFMIGLQSAKSLTNPWARSRALAKFGALAHSLD
ncbi:exported hypothetical protein [Candidatus Terasakiella magnetica]|uniref:Peptidoglycan binding-like domain-containing protein n=1 Tax=Candidatus Terasakiella magnetica TaxID=1867952 RepID=A0A1C3RE75_9PROT|nr:peptidoglycan-binding domain-containing protein [Candidatus Terasakiella magnetica]SCA55583.1 exported hypothetical protein [Candidatus Terasakiella magnetica]